MSDLVYVYAIVPASFDVSRAPSGIDDGPVTIQRRDGVGALVSLVDADEYTPEALEGRTADVDWLGPRARAHDRVQTWGSDLGALVPLAMFTLFRDHASVGAMLERKRERLEAALGIASRGREYGVRVFRLTAEVERSVTSWSPPLAALEREAEAASPGQQYLLKRKLDGARAEEARRLSADLANRVHQTLAGRAIDVSRASIPPSGEGGAAGEAILDAAYFVDHAGIDVFRGTLTGLIDEWQPRGFRFEFTGPWPPYHFARAGAEDE
jgi:hypothetical protein